MARVKSYTVLERNKFVLIWYHAEGQDPDWEPPVIEEIENGTWVYRGRTEHHINAHIEVRMYGVHYPSSSFRFFSFLLFKVWSLFS